VVALRSCGRRGRLFFSRCGLGLGGWGGGGGGGIPCEDITNARRQI